MKKRDHIKLHKTKFDAVSPDHPRQNTIIKVNDFLIYLDAKILFLEPINITVLLKK